MGRNGRHQIGDICDIFVIGWLGTYVCYTMGVENLSMNRCIGDNGGRGVVCVAMSSCRMFAKRVLFVELFVELFVSVSAIILCWDMNMGISSRK